MGHWKKSFLWLLSVLFLLAVGFLPRAEGETFLIMGDSRGKLYGVNEKVLTRLLAEATGGEEKPRTLFFLGDLSFWGTERELASWYRTVTTFFPPEEVYPVKGNHDQRVNWTRFPHLPLAAIPSCDRMIYFLDRGDIRFVVLDSSGHRIDAAQRAWLARVLAPPRPPHAVVLVHEPFFPTGAHLGTSLDRYPEERDATWAILDTGGVEMVFASHEHYYARRIIPSLTRPGKVIHHVGVGSAGAPLHRTLATEEKPVVFRISYAYAVLGEEDGRLVVTVYGPGREILDRFTGES